VVSALFEGEAGAQEANFRNRTGTCDKSPIIVRIPGGRKIVFRRGDRGDYGLNNPTEIETKIRRREEKLLPDSVHAGLRRVKIPGGLKGIGSRKEERSGNNLDRE